MQRRISVPKTCKIIGLNVFIALSACSASIDGRDSSIPGIGSNAGPLAHWPLDESSGNRVDDTVGSRDGRWFDGNDDDLSEESDAGLIGNALKFTDSSPNDNYIDLGDLGGSTAESRSFTYSAWINIDGDASGNDFIVSEASTNNSETKSGIKVNDGVVVAEIADDAGNSVEARGARNIAGTGWHHVAATADGATLKLYVDGRLQRSQASLGSLGSITVNTASIGMLNRGDPCCEVDGFIDDVLVYSRPLTQSEIAQIFRGN